MADIAKAQLFAALNFAEELQTAALGEGVGVSYNDVCFQPAKPYETGCLTCVAAPERRRAVGVGRC
eukprot:SAG11_NODE_707_length_7651_cov_4.133872_8_plen_66_part_00